MVDSLPAPSLHDISHGARYATLYDRVLMNKSGHFKQTQKKPHKELYCFWSGWPDLNRRPLHPQCSALPDCATSRIVYQPGRLHQCPVCEQQPIGYIPVIYRRKFTLITACKRKRPVPIRYGDRPFSINYQLPISASAAGSPVRHASAG